MKRIFTQVVPWKQILWEKPHKEGDAEEMPMTVGGWSYTKLWEVSGLPRKMYSDKLQADLSLSAGSLSRCVRQSHPRSHAQSQQHSIKHHMPYLTYLALMFSWGLFGGWIFFLAATATLHISKMPLACAWHLKNVTASSQVFNRDTTASITVAPCTTTTFHCTVSTPNTTLKNDARVRKHFTKLKQRLRSMQLGLQTVLSL